MDTVVRSRPSILIVEDERLVALDLQSTLNRLGFSASAVFNTDDALYSSAQKRPDVVLMDIRVDGHCDGIEAARLLRKQFGVPVVFVTAYSDPTTLERAKRANAQGFLIKPVREQDLRATVELAIGLDARTEKQPTTGIDSVNSHLVRLEAMAFGIHRAIVRQTSVIKANTQFALASLKKNTRSTPDEDISAAMLDALQSSDDLWALSRDLLAFSSVGSSLLVPTDVHQAIKSAANDVAERQPSVTLNLQPVSPVVAPQGYVTEIVRRLLQNACDALRGCADPRIRISCAEQGGWVVIDVQDNGPGIAPEALPRVFDPFFTTRANRKGLGLSFCHGAVADMGGSIHIDSSATGTRVRVQAPPDKRS